jgi:deoxyribose-phosphate aldolase
VYLAPVFERFKPQALITRYVFSMELAKYFDHTLLKPDTTAADIRKLCEEAKRFGFAAVCVAPYFVQDAVEALQGSEVKTATVIGYPMGYSATAAKVEEIKRAIDENIHELDVMINLSAVKSGNWNFVRNDLDRMVTAAHLRGKIIKVILETGLLLPEEIDQLCDICLNLRADYVKTSSGMNGDGATPEIVSLLVKKLGKKIKVKASGGVRSREAAIALIEAGADRIGSSACAAILQQ